LSVTVTLNEHDEVFPLASVAKNEIFVTPIGKSDPLTGPNVCVITTPGQLSFATGAAHDTIAPQTPALLLTEIFIGHDVKVGA
jgi:hypothetical protein